MSKRPLPRPAMTHRRRAVGSRSVQSIRRRPRGGLLARIIPAGVLAAAIAVVLVIAFGQVGGATSSARTEREVVSAADGVVQSTVTGTGNLEPVTEEDVGFQTSGTLRAVDVKEGDYVHKGQLLATLDSATAALTLKQARATLAEARTTLTVDRKTLAGEDADPSSSDDTSATVDSGAVAEDVGDQVSTATTAATPTTTATTVTTPTTPTTPTTTATTPATPATTVTTLTTTVTTPATTTTAAPGRGRSTPTAADHNEPSTTSAARSTTSDSGSTRSSSGSSGDSGSSSDVTAATIDSDQLAIVDDEQSVKQDETGVSETRLTAPVSGTITSLESIVPGDSISSGSDTNASDSSTADTAGTDGSGDSDATGASSASSDPAADSSTGATTSSSGSSSSSTFAEIDTLRQLSMSVSFTEADISQLKVGQAATVTLDALSDTELAGKVTAVSSLGTTDDDVVSYDATITLDQYDTQVKPGMSASAAVIIKQGHGVTVPSGAVTGTGTLASVTEDSNGKDTTKQVIVGLRGSSRDLIVSGLKSGTDLVETETLPSTGSSADDTTTSGSSASSAAGRFSGGGGFARGGFGGGAAGGFGGGAAAGGGAAR